MKKLLLTAVFAVITIVSINAQEFGAKAGVNFASLNGDEDFDGRTSFFVGGVVEFEISESFSLQPELLYSSQGAKSSFSEEGFDFESTIKLDYLNIPLMAKYYVTEGLSIEAGPQVGFLLSAKAEYKEDGESDSEDIKDELKSVDFGLNFGLGYKLDSGLNFGARYNLGLSNVPDEDDFDLKNGVFQIAIGYFF